MQYDNHLDRDALASEYQSEDKQGQGSDDQEGEEGIQLSLIRVYLSGVEVGVVVVVGQDGQRHRLLGYLLDSEVQRFSKVEGKIDVLAVHRFEVVEGNVEQRALRERVVDRLHSGLGVAVGLRASLHKGDFHVSVGNRLLDDVDVQGDLGVPEYFAVLLDCNRDPDRVGEVQLLD